MTQVSPTQHQFSAPPAVPAVPVDPVGERKRNKLGYHRASIACVHCRRRKIRCLPCANDDNRRCENCIRLGKDCQFFPIDQQPPASATNSAGSSTPGIDNTTTTTPTTAAAFTSAAPASAAGHDRLELRKNSASTPLSTASSKLSGGLASVGMSDGISAPLPDQRAYSLATSAGNTATTVASTESPALANLENVPQISATSSFKSSLPSHLHPGPLLQFHGDSNGEEGAGAPPLQFSPISYGPAPDFSSLYEDPFQNSTATNFSPFQSPGAASPSFPSALSPLSSPWSTNETATTYYDHNPHPSSAALTIDLDMDMDFSGDELSHHGLWSPDIAAVPSMMHTPNTATPNLEAESISGFCPNPLTASSTVNTAPSNTSMWAGVSHDHTSAHHQEPSQHVRAMSFAAALPSPTGSMGFEASSHHSHSLSHNHHQHHHQLQPQSQPPASRRMTVPELPPSSFSSAASRHSMYTSSPQTLQPAALALPSGNNYNITHETLSQPGQQEQSQQQQCGAEMADLGGHQQTFALQMPSGVSPPGDLPIVDSFPGGGGVDDTSSQVAGAEAGAGAGGADTAAMLSPSFQPFSGWNRAYFTQSPIVPDPETGTGVGGNPHTHATTDADADATANADTHTNPSPDAAGTTTDPGLLSISPAAIHEPRSLPSSSLSSVP